MDDDWSPVKQETSPKWWWPEIVNHHRTEIKMIFKDLRGQQWFTKCCLFVGRLCYSFEILSNGNLLMLIWWWFLRWFDGTFIEYQPDICWITNKKDTISNKTLGAHFSWGFSIYSMVDVPNICSISPCPFPGGFLSPFLPPISSLGHWSTIATQRWSTLATEKTGWSLERSLGDFGWAVLGRIRA